MVISGSSMAPFLIHGRDSIFFRAPGRNFGKVISYFTAGRTVCRASDLPRVHADGYDIIEDAQTEIEHHNATEADLCTGDKVERKGKILVPKNVLVGVCCTGLDSHYQHRRF